MPAHRILVVDDEPNIVELTRLYLEQAGFQVQTAADGARALKIIRSDEPALVVLDIMLPEVDGFEVCRQTRAFSEVPIIMLTARDDDVDKIVGLEIGADDYLTKPFNPRELVARVKAILRRSEPRVRVNEEAIVLGDLRIDRARREVFIDDEAIQLRNKEFELLVSFAENPEIVLTRERLLELVWGYDFLGETRTVDVHVAQLRKKLSGSAVRIETVTGVGYKLLP
jgi:DNA-binding response OmpR family regulator